MLFFPHALSSATLDLGLLIEVQSVPTKHDRPSRVRRGGAADLPAIARLEVRFFGEHAFDRSQLNYYLRRARGVFLVAGSSSGVAAYLIGATSHTGGASVFWILSTAVLPAMRRSGLATRLVKNALRRAKLDGATAARLHVAIKNAGARRFYERLGFVEERFAQDYYGAGDHGVVMARPLQNKNS